ncbi:MFS transporter [Paenibacillus humicola]|uniref:MFS transporter n=1 Tax=Paenibacillus humicola TaxID=3110540 RepID=UPI00237B67F3|nr:MFS transporter [Paenibacillus humicola]
MKRMAIFYFLFFLAQAAYAPYVSLYFSGKGWDGTSIGVVLSLWSLVGIAAQPAMGLLNDRLRHPRRLLMLAAVLAPVTALGFIAFDSYAVVLAVSVVFAWFQSAANPLADTIAVETAAREGFAFGSVRLWGAFSYAVGTLVTGFLYVRTGYEWSFPTYLAISLIAVASLLSFRQPAGVRHRVTLFNQAKDVVRNRAFLLFTFISLLLTIALAVNASFLPIYYKEMGFDKSLIGTAYAIAALTEVPMFWAAAKIAARIGRYAVLGIAALCYVAKCFLMYAVPGIHLALALQTLDGIAFAFFASMTVETVEAFSGERTKATYQSVFAAGTYGLGGIIGNTAGGAVIDREGAPFLYAVLGTLSLVSLALYAGFGLSRRRRAREEGSGIGL